MTVWIYEYLFYTLCYNLILLDFVAHMVPAVAVGTLPHFLVQQGIPDSSRAVPILATVSAISTRNSGFFQWRRVIRTKIWAPGTLTDTGRSLYPGLHSG